VDVLQIKENLTVKNILMTMKDYETTTLVSPIVEKTLELASSCSSKVHILHIVPPYREPPYSVDSKMFRDEIATELRNVHNHLQNLSKSIQDVNIDATALLAHGSIISTILYESERLAADLVVIGRHRHGPLYGTLMDGTEKGLLAKSSCPIMFIPV
jgi:nucleotide-binding universal stress UspA family protein